MTDVPSREPDRARRPRWMSKDEFLQDLQQADPGLAEDLREMLPETTDDLPWR